MKKLVFVMLLAALGVAGAKAKPKKPPASGPLDGRHFKIVLTSPDASPAPSTLGFAAGALTAEGASGPYTIGKAVRGMTFEAHFKGAAKSTIVWMGTVDGERIDGSMARTDGKVKTAFTFTGSEEKP